MHESRPFVTVVSGVPRSGTSLMMQMLVHGGMQPLTDDLRPADENNLRGYYEYDPVKRTRLDASWVERAQGRVVKVVHGILRELPIDLDYRVVFMQRDSLERAISQRKMLASQGDLGAQDVGSLIAKLEEEEIACLDWLRLSPNVRYLLVDYAALMDGAATVIPRITALVGGHLDAAAMATAVDPRLHRNQLK